MTTRYLSVFLPRLPTDRLRRCRPTPAGCGAPDLASSPLVAIGKVKGTQRIVAVDAEAARHGIKPGLTLADGRALCPALAVADADPAAEAALLIGIVDWCKRFTPMAAADGPDGVLLDIGGVAHLFDGEAGLLHGVETGLTRQGFEAHAAVGTTPEAAWALARFTTCKIAPSPASQPSSDWMGKLAGARDFLPPGEKGARDVERGSPLSPGGRRESDGPDEGVAHAEFDRIVADLPLAALRLDADILSGMAQAGLRRLQDLLLRPRAPIMARFGPKPFERLDGFLGRIKSPMSPRFEAPVYVAERRFASGITHQGDVVAALLPLAHHLCALLSRYGEGTRRIEATLFRVDGAVKRLVVGASRPTRSPDVILALFRERIARLDEEGLDTGYGFDLIRLAILASESLTSVQEALVENQGDSAQDLSVLADRLGARLGLKRVLRFTDHDTHIPEFAVVALPAAQTPPPRMPSPGGRESVPSRPIRLFDRPEPIDTVAAVPDGPPLKFRWRRVMHEIAAIEGPERISPEWWRDETALTRDYFQAEDREGRRFWLFREGLLGHETARARWFLHGLFG